jgi:hypothetical protein
VKRKENLLPRFTPKRSFYVMYFKRSRNFIHNC